MAKRSGAASNDQTDRAPGQASRWWPAHRGLRACLWLGVLLLVLGFSFQGTRGLWNTDEGRYVDNALQMVDSGNYLVPAYNADHLNFSKPPLVLWAIAASVRVMGKDHVGGAHSLRAGFRAYRTAAVRDGPRAGAGEALVAGPDLRLQPGAVHRRQRGEHR
jgi:4-amino-4-deoxy-L-arabinose transferase and related glycosyltransferases of PMT family